MTAWVLVHSPFVGPSTWHGVAAALRDRGDTALVPEPAPPLEAPEPWWAHAAGEVAAAGAAAGLDRTVLAAHSGAGPMLAVFGSALAAGGTTVEAYLFVDAGLPAPGQSAFDTLPPALQRRISDLARDGLLPPWCDWWGPEVLETVVPDPQARRRLEAECRPVPLGLFHEVPPVPAAWPDAPCGYLCSTYEAEAGAAEARGWPVLRRPGGSHLDPLVAPSEIAGLLVALVDRIGLASR